MPTRSDRFLTTWQLVPNWLKMYININAHSSTSFSPLPLHLIPLLKMPKETLTVYHKSAAHPKQPALGHIKPADIPDSKPPADHPSLQSACPPLFRPNIRFSIATYEDEMRHPSTLQLRFGIPIPTVPELDRFVRRLGLIHRDMPGETKGEWRLQGGHLPGDTVM